MRNYLLVRSRRDVSAQALPVRGNIREVFSADDAIAALDGEELLSGWEDANPYATAEGIPEGVMIRILKRSY